VKRIVATETGAGHLIMGGWTTRTERDFDTYDVVSEQTRAHQDNENVKDRTPPSSWHKLVRIRLSIAREMDPRSIY